MKLCKNCKHLLPDSLGKITDLSRCGYQHPVSLVTGLLREQDTLPFAELERRSTGRCGLSAEHWEAAEHVMAEDEEKAIKELMEGFPHV